MDITKCLTISTGHVSKETVRFLMKQDGPLAVYPKGEVGFWIYCSDTEDNRGRDIPDDLFQCMMLAKKNDCCWLCIDRDGGFTPELKVYEW